MGWVVLACEVLLVIVFWFSRQVLFFPLFFAYMALNCLTAPLYVTGNFIPWYWSQIAVNALLLGACWEAFEVQAMPVRMRPDPKVPGELKFLTGSAILFGAVLIILLAQRPIQSNLPPVLFRIRLYSLVMAVAFTFETWFYFAFQPPGRYHLKSGSHTFLLMTFSAITLGALLVRIGDADGRKWEVVQVTQQAIKCGVLLLWINLFWEVRRAVPRSVRHAPTPGSPTAP